MCIQLVIIHGVREPREISSRPHNDMIMNSDKFAEAAIFNAIGDYSPDGTGLSEIRANARRARERHSLLVVDITHARTIKRILQLN